MRASFPVVVIMCVCCLWISACAPGMFSVLPPTPATQAEAWQQDLQYLASQLPRRHKDLFFAMTRAEFEAEVAGLDAAIPSMSENEIVLRLARLVAMVGDAHTNLNLFQEGAGFGFYPLSLYSFNDGLYVLGTAQPYAEALGARLVQIGETDVEEVTEAVRPFIAHENEAYLQLAAPRHLVIPELLQFLGVLPKAETGHFVFQNSRGERFAIDIDAAPSANAVDWVTMAENRAMLPLYRQHPEKAYWFHYLENSNTLYLQYNVCRDDNPSFRDFADEALVFAGSHDVDHFVIDLRNNGGGDSSVMQPLISGLRQRPALNQPGRLFVIVGRQTFSSAILNALELKNETQAMLVGEPTGGRPNHYGEVKSLTLPNSGLVVTYSTKYFRHAAEDTPSLMPDLIVRMTAADYFARRDPVLDAILAWDKEK